MLLADLLADVPHRVLTGLTDRPVTSVTQDSRQASAGSVFVAVKGLRVDGHRFVPSVSAEAVVVEDDVGAREGTTVVQVDDTRQALAHLAATLFGHPSREVPVIGVTGTNGKTTTTWMLEAIARAAGRRPGVVGTTGNRVDGRVLETVYTTPEAPEWQALLREMVDAGCGLVAAEVSSIGLAARRVDATHFAVAVYTNLSRDHLDYHGSMEAYAAAKARLFTEFQPGRAILHAGEPSIATLAEGTPTWTFGLTEGDIRPVTLELDTAGSRGIVTTPVGDLNLDIALVGDFNVENALAAAGAALAVGLGLEAVERGLGSLECVPGRLEAVPTRKPFDVLVDYAHTPDALATVLATLRPLTKGRLICVFGCGGDRDAGKRPEMGRAATEGSDLVVATSDNPRSEDPLAILADVQPGLDARAHIEPDRRRAIHQAISLAREGDVVLIAGKGHETTQEIAGTKHAFDDRLVALEVL
ncbi:MAG: UDP-N-acetylmuramoyl-L-alanyl-D-glutamate--2,6-diaminopimelate ligase [Proteobacteria bacterium]|nr:UDP-N-acetylmuramoyl-L-alanyl-D-glutamate--2,6-diaminopimelate ligase [Pseudomonadota bacterium]MCP4916092.1 UDP-N-acetylmuramoyl-L-alanyl-D-glutamate--2,6-diaminopimelate ligase [Pseudomonadota bacterium]